MDQWSLLLTVAPPSTPSLKSVVSNVNSLASVLFWRLGGGIKPTRGVHPIWSFHIASPGAFQPGDTPGHHHLYVSCWTWRVYECTMTQVVYSLFGVPFALHSEHISIHEGSGALVVKLFAQKEINARTYPALNRYSSKQVYPCLSQFQYEAISRFHYWNFFLPFVFVD